MCCRFMIIFKKIITRKRMGPQGVENLQKKWKENKKNIFQINWINKGDWQLCWEKFRNFIKKNWFSILNCPCLKFDRINEFDQLLLLMWDMRHFHAIVFKNFKISITAFFRLFILEKKTQFLEMYCLI